MHNGLDDKRRRRINLRDRRVEEVLPEHFAKDYPKFISLLESYYEFENENNPTELLDHLFETRDITQTDLDLLAFIEDELLLGEAYFEGFPDPRAAANFSSVLFRSKGSKYSIEWFFRAFFNEDVEVIYPKRNIFNIGESQIGPDSLRYITDNKLYQTFAILLKTGRSISEWKDIYKLFVHPAGMYLGGSVLKIMNEELQTLDSAETDTRLTPTYSVSGGSSNEGTTGTVTVTATNSPDTNLRYYIEHLTTSPTDFTVPRPPTDLSSAGNITITSNSGSVDLEYASDLLVEGGEVFAFKLYDWEGRKLDSANITISDVVPQYTVNLDATSITEGSPITGEVVSDDPQNEVVTLSIIGGLSGDTRISSPGTVTMSSSPQPFSISTTLNAAAQGAITGQVQASSAFDTEASPTFTLNDGPASYTLSSPSYVYSEGNTITFNVSGSNVPSGTYKLRLAETGTADNADFVEDVSSALNLSVTTAASGTLGSTTATLTNTSDPAEWFSARLYDPTNTTKLDSVNVDIVGAGTPTYTVSAPDTLEGKQIPFTLTPTNANGEDVNWSFTSGTTNRIVNGDSTGTVSSVNGVTSFEVRLRNDDYHYGSMGTSLTVQVQGATSGSTATDTLTVLDSDAVYSISVNNTTPTEGDTLTFTIGGTDWSQNPIYLQFQTVTGTISTADFTNPSVGSVAPISARQAIANSTNPGSGTYTIDLVNDGLSETESFTAKLYTASTGGSPVATTPTITISDAASPTQTNAMDVLPLFSTNTFTAKHHYTYGHSGIGYSAQTVTNLEFLVTDDGSDIVIRIGPSEDADGDQGPLSQSAQYYPDNSTTVQALVGNTTAVTLNGLGGNQGWGVQWELISSSTGNSYTTSKFAWSTIPSSSNSPWIIGTGTGTPGRAAIVRTVSVTDNGSTSTESDVVDFRLIFSKSGETDIEIDFRLNLQATVDI